MAIAQQVLATQQHLLTGVGHRLFEGAQPLPRIFTQIADAGVKGGTAPGFQRPVAYPVELFSNRQHVVEAQAGCQQRLMGVTQHHIGQGEGFGHGGRP